MLLPADVTPVAGGRGGELVADALRQQAEAELRAERREESEAATGASGGTDPEAGGEPADGFTRAAFSEAAARYRGDPEGPRVFSIAV